MDIRKNVRAGCPVFFNNLLHGWQQSYLQPLPGFAAGVEYRVAHNAVVLEVDYIDEGHAPAVETEHEQVARRFQLGIPPQVGRSDERYLFLAQRPFHRFLPAHVQPGKGIFATYPDALLACLIVHRPEIAEVHVDAVLRNAAHAQVVYIVRNEHIVDVFEVDFPQTAKAQQRVQPACVGSGSALLPLFEQGIDVLQDEFIHTLVVLLLPVFQHEALQRKAGIASLQQTVVPDKVFFLVPDKTVDEAHFPTGEDTLGRINHPVGIPPVIRLVDPPPQRVFFLLTAVQHANRKGVNSRRARFTRMYDNTNTQLFLLVL